MMIIASPSQLTTTVPVNSDWFYLSGTGSGFPDKEPLNVVIDNILEMVQYRHIVTTED